MVVGIHPNVCLVAPSPLLVSLLKLLSLLFTKPVSWLTTDSLLFLGKGALRSGGSFAGLTGSSTKALEKSLLMELRGSLLLYKAAHLMSHESIMEFFFGLYMRYIQQWSIEYPRNTHLIQLFHFCPNSDVAGATKLLQVLVGST